MRCLPATSEQLNWQLSILSTKGKFYLSFLLFPFPIHSTVPFRPVQFKLSFLFAVSFSRKIHLSCQLLPAAGKGLKLAPKLQQKNNFPFALWIAAQFYCFSIQSPFRPVAALSWIKTHFQCTFLELNWTKMKAEKLMTRKRLQVQSLNN